MWVWVPNRGMIQKYCWHWFIPNDAPRTPNNRLLMFTRPWQDVGEKGLRLHAALNKCERFRNVGLKKGAACL